MNVRFRQHRTYRRIGLLSADIVAKSQIARRQKKSDRRPPIDVAPITLPRSPVSLSSGDEVPHIFTRKSRVQPKEILIASAKRLLQQNLPRGDICSAAELGCYSNHLLGDGELHGRNSLAVINLPAAKRRYEFSSSNVDCHATLPWGSCPCNRGTISRLNRPVCDDFTFGGRARRRPRRDRHYCPNGARHNGHSLRNYGALPSARRKRAEGRATYCFGFAAVVDGLIEPQGSLDTVVLGRVFLVTSL
jgi:hypothetical protein